ncbi:MAG: hypothetical protein DRJ03_20790 [Chloroflexi bacterium]|nr:MAG: hypothetical protein DRJ03_20790 [Chloroflexota bacterium]
MKVTKEAIQATQQSIDHWERMIEWVKRQDPEGIPSYQRMELEIGEDWYSESCPLCQCFSLPDVPCKDCPLGDVFGFCNNPAALNAWPNVRWSRTWGEWLEAADVMLLQLETVLELLKEASDDSTA